MKFLVVLFFVTQAISIHVPTIDFKNFLFGTSDTRQAIADDIKTALTTTGFFLLKNHGTSRHLIDTVFNATYPFFDRPLEEKQKYIVDVATSVSEAGGVKPMFWYTEPRAESYQGDQPNNKEMLVATSGAGSKHTVWDHMAEELQTPEMFQLMSGLKLLTNEIFRALSLALGIDEEFFVQKHKIYKNDYYCFNYYPPLLEEYRGELLLPAHTDYQSLALGIQDEVPGLQVWDRENKQWIDIPCDPDVIVVNTGDAIERWSNGHFIANNHRVVVNSKNKARLSFYLFIGSDPSTIVDPRDTGFTNPIWKPITYGDMIQSRVDAMVDNEVVHDQEYGDPDALKQDFVVSTEGHPEL